MQTDISEGDTLKEKQRLGFLMRKDTQKWKRNMPATFGAHQVFFISIFF